MLLNTHNSEALFEKKITKLIKFFCRLEKEHNLKANTLEYLFRDIDYGKINYYYDVNKVLYFFYADNHMVARYYINEDNKLVHYLVSNCYKRDIEKYVNELYKTLI